MSLTTQFYTMIAMIAVGGYLGAALDTYSRLLNRRKRKFWFIFINDILFWVVQGLIIFYCLYSVNFGEIRFYIFVALFCGFAFYQSLLKNLYQKFLELLIRFITRTYNVSAKLTSMLLIRPVIVLFTFVISIAVGVGKFLLKLSTFLGGILLTIFKFFLQPLNYFGKLSWKLVPNSFKMKLNVTFKKIINFYQKIYTFFNKKKR